MLHCIRRFTGILFYALGMSFFGAYILLRNDIAGVLPAWWMQVADLPFILSALAYGGVSFYGSIRGDRMSRVLPFAIGIPLVLLLLGFIILNFWPHGAVQS